MSKRFTRSELGASIRTSAVVAGLAVWGMVRPGLAGETGQTDAAAATQPAPQPSSTQPATQPSTQPGSEQAPIDPAVRALIIKLGDDDPKVRDDATRKLSALGKAAIPALREAIAGDDPEARSRAQSLLHHMERRLPPPAPPQNGNLRSRSVRMSMNQGIRTVDVNDNGRTIHILCQADGQIEMSVTGIEDGKEATETYKAKDAEELRKDNPEAFAIYDQWAGGKGGMVIGGGQIGIHIQNFPGLPVPPGGAPPILPQNPQDLQLRIEQQQKQIEELQRRLQDEVEQRVHERMRGHAGKDDAPPPADAGKAETPATKPG